MRTKIIASAAIAAAIATGAVACKSTATSTAPPPASSSAPVKAVAAPATSAMPTPPPPSTPPQSVTLLKVSGMGSEATPHFSSPTGNYKVSWSYSGNADQYGGSNFIITEDASNDMNAPLSLPDDIAATGQGSAETAGDPGSHFFNVQSVGSWTITVVSEP
jgi:hypothetical protein